MVIVCCLEVSRRVVPHREAYRVVQGFFVKLSRSSVGWINDTGSPLRIPAKHGHACDGLFSRTVFHYVLLPRSQHAHFEHDSNLDKPN